jgi:hypothetical protein
MPPNEIPKYVSPGDAQPARQQPELSARREPVSNVYRTSAHSKSRTIISKLADSQFSGAKVLI